MSKPVILLGISGSIAAVKAPALVRLLVDHDFDVRCVMTKSAEKFVSPLALATFSKERVISDVFCEDAHRLYHVEWAEKATLMLMAPASATTIARCAQGIAEDMVSLTYLTTTAPVLIVPAMHTSMWEHPATQNNVRILKERGVTFLGPHQGPLADQTHGEGRMVEPEEVFKLVESLVKKSTQK